MIDEVITKIRGHEKYMTETINLIASENKLSYLAREALMSDLGNRVAEGWAGERLFPGLSYYNQLEDEGLDIIKELFSADFVDCRPISGTMANMIVYTALTSPGDTIMSVSIKDGGHISMSGATPKNVFNLEVVSIPMIDSKINVIDEDKTIELLNKVRPKLLVLGGSVIIKRQNIKKICNFAHSVGTIVIFDASHVAGLIAGGIYPNPFKDGVDIITTSTCKTIPGPQHGLVMCTDEYKEKIKRTTFPSLHSGHHLHHTVATFITMYELKKFGKEYTEQIYNNIITLGTELIKQGFNVYKYDETHISDTHMLMILIQNAEKCEELLERANIIANRNMTPWDLSFKNTSGLRIGTPEVTRIGMVEKDMKEIAIFMKRVLLDLEKPENVKSDVMEFMSKFKSVEYCFKQNIWENNEMKATQHD